LIGLELLWLSQFLIPMGEFASRFILACTFQITTYEYQFVQSFYTFGFCTYFIVGILS
jgi:hypothetical protein